jgi:serine-type D-Ala-D-Ala carboxypeptidase (penicillin-binding protein 5/6)
MRRFLLTVVATVIVIFTYLYMRPVPTIAPVSQIVNVPKTQAIDLPWPSSGQAALGASGYGVLATHNVSAPVPIASVAKVITAIAVLKQKPIAAGSQGPTITLDATDVGIFNDYYAKNGSVAPVTAGEQISEFQVLQAMLIPSANNMADSLAKWAFGSVGAYVSYANQLVKSLGLSSTLVGDASGFNDNTTSTADDLVKLGVIALTNPAIAQAVGQSSAQIPVAGTINNLNSLLGQDGVVGIKTGNTDKAGGCYLFAAQRLIAGHNITLIGAILGAPQLDEAIKAAQPLIQTADSGFEQVTIVHKNQTLGYYRTPWGGSSQLKSAKDLGLLVWKGQDIKVLNEPASLTTPAKAGADAGTVKIQSGQQTVSSPLLLAQDLDGAPWTWHLFH